MAKPGREMLGAVGETVVILVLSLVTALVGAVLGLVFLFVVAWKLKLGDLGILLMYVVPFATGTLTFLVTFKTIHAAISSSETAGTR